MDGESEDRSATYLIIDRCDARFSTLYSQFRLFNGEWVE
jgi:hypothetical protein